MIAVPFDRTISGNVVRFIAGIDFHKTLMEDMLSFLPPTEQTSA